MLSFEAKWHTSLSCILFVHISEQHDILRDARCSVFFHLTQMVACQKENNLVIPSRILEMHQNV